MIIGSSKTRALIPRLLAAVLACLGVLSFSTFGVLVLATAPASAQSTETGSSLIKMQPGAGSSLGGNGDRYTLTVEPGKTTNQKLIVTNTSTEFRVTAALTGVEATKTTDGTLSYREPSTGSTSKGNWIKFVPSAVQLNPGESREVPLTITIPAVEPSGSVNLGIALTIQSTVSVSNPDQTAGTFARSQFIGVDLTVLGPPAPQLSVLGARPIQQGGLDYLEVFLRNTGSASATGLGRFDVPDMGVSGTFDLETVEARSDSTQRIRWQPNRQLDDRFGVALTITYDGGSTTSWSGRVGLGDRTPAAPPLDATDTPSQLVRDKDAQAELATPTPTVETPTTEEKSDVNLVLIIGIPLALLLLLGLALLALWLLTRRSTKRKKSRKRSTNARPAANARPRPRAADDAMSTVVDSLRLLVSEIADMKNNMGRPVDAYNAPHLQPGFYDHPSNGRMAPAGQSPTPVTPPAFGPAAYPDTAQFVPTHAPGDLRIQVPPTPVVPITNHQPAPVVVTRAFVYDHDQVVEARRAGHAWDTIAIALGTTAEDILMRFTNEENRRDAQRAAEVTTTASTAEPPVGPPSLQDKISTASLPDHVQSSMAAPTADVAADVPSPATTAPPASVTPTPPQVPASTSSENELVVTPTSFLSSPLSSTPDFVAAGRERQAEADHTVFEETVTVTRTVRRSGDANVDATELSLGSPFMVAEEILDLPAPVRRTNKDGKSNKDRGHLRAVTNDGVTHDGVTDDPQAI